MNPHLSRDLTTMKTLTHAVNSSLFLPISVAAVMVIESLFLYI
jgi:hypothetical protein